MRKRLIHKNFDSNILEEVKIYQPVEDCAYEEPMDSQVDIAENDAESIKM